MHSRCPVACVFWFSCRHPYEYAMCIDCAQWQGSGLAIKSAKIANAKATMLSVASMTKVCPRVLRNPCHSSRQCHLRASPSCLSPSRPEFASVLFGKRFP
jgi:hypothetical protein